MFFHQFKNELLKLFAKKRTYIGFAMLILAQLLIVSLLRFSKPAHQGLRHTIERSGLDAGKYVSMLTVATFMVLVLAYSLLPLYVALVGGDMVSKEAEDGTLRMVLSRPVTRVRLLCLKWIAGVVFSILLVTALAAGGLLFCGATFPVTGGLFAQLPEQTPSVLNFSDALPRFLLAHLFMVAKAVTIMSLALMFSCCNIKPAAAAISALSLIMIDRILMDIPYFHDLKQYFLGHYLNCWQLLFSDPIPWWQVGQSVSLLAGLSLTFLILGISIFQVRDIKS
jgi:ABC-2 type transport system permease protein